MIAKYISLNMISLYKKLPILLSTIPCWPCHTSHPKLPPYHLPANNCSFMVYFKLYNIFTKNVQNILYNYIITLSWQVHLREKIKNKGITFTNKEWKYMRDVQQLRKVPIFLPIFLSIFLSMWKSFKFLASYLFLRFSIWSLLAYSS